MRTNEFFYWLQGYFELSGSTAALTPDQFSCIGRHLALVGADGAVRTSKARSIIEFALDGAMTTEVATARLRAEIHHQFVHVIDPEAGPEAQAKLNEIHAGPGGIPNRPGMRC